MEPIVVSARHRRSEAGILIGKREDAQAARRKEHRCVDAFGVHRFQLHLTGPAALRVTAVDVLVLGEIATAMRCATGAARILRHFWKNCAEIAHIL